VVAAVIAGDGPRAHAAADAYLESTERIMLERLA
jgi:DNA-binding FadR family transcriptional regulator